MSEPLAPRIPRDRVLTPGQGFLLAITAGAFIWGAVYLVWQWFKS